MYDSQSIETTRDDDDDLRSNWFSEYNIYLPINKIETFNQFDKFLIETEQFRTKFVSYQKKNFFFLLSRELIRKVLLIFIAFIYDLFR